MIGVGMVVRGGHFGNGRRVWVWVWLWNGRGISQREIISSRFLFRPGSWHRSRQGDAKEASIQCDQITVGFFVVAFNSYDMVIVIISHRCNE